MNLIQYFIFKTLEKEVARGRIRFLGLSNFNETQIKNVFNNAKEIKPAVLQIELHAYLQQVNLRSLCEELGIVVTAYSPLGSPGAKEHFINKYKYRYLLNIVKNFLIIFDLII